MSLKSHGKVREFKEKTKSQGKVRELSTHTHTFSQRYLNIPIHNFRSKVNDCDEESDNSGNGDKREDFTCNIKKEGGDFFNEDDKNNIRNEQNGEKDEDEAMFKTKIEVECHEVQYDDKSGKEKLFKCDLCPKKYKRYNCLFVHKKYIHEKDRLKKFKCNQCEYVTLRKSSLKVHLKIHDTNSYLKCHFCQYMTVQLRDLEAHIFRKHKLENKGDNKIKITSKIHQWTKCLYSTVRKSDYDYHILSCLKLKTDKLHKCPICHFTAIQKGNLKKHIKTHNKIKELKCLFCKYQCDLKCDLDNHIIFKHPNVLKKSNNNLITSKLYLCEKCNYKTTSAAYLKKHDCSFNGNLVQAKPRLLMVVSKPIVGKMDFSRLVRTCQKSTLKSLVQIPICISSLDEITKFCNRSKINDGDEESDNSGNGNEREDFICNIKEDFSKEGDKNGSRNEENEEKDEDEAMFETKIEVEDHEVQYDDTSGKEKLFKCDLCPKKYKRYNSLFVHKKYIHEKDGLKKFKCKICEYVTLRKSSLKLHLKIHDKKKYLKCHFCEYSAAELRNLNAHIFSKHKLENKGDNKIKITSKIYKCTKCLYSTVRKNDYDYHIFSCLKLKTDKLHKCPICHFTAIQKSNLKRHIKTHNTIKELKCLFCKFQCNLKCNLDNHIIFKHPNELKKSNKNLITSKLHSCENCNYKTTNTSSLKKHVKKCKFSLDN
ncbi:unnamed protein product [Brassicogethes aeneus]|uniref:C2H2-type domain-containing protein n=1 Tax=Brassicogethes aeneus TaxID=1431903 RepID=A0A9P0AW98_BRAAE|nr:unnamed protein product [Brassicogethes aeneus]